MRSVAHCRCSQNSTNKHGILSRSGAGVEAEFEGVLGAALKFEADEVGDLARSTEGRSKKDEVRVEGLKRRRVESGRFNASPFIALTRRHPS